MELTVCTLWVPRVETPGPDSTSLNGIKLRSVDYKEDCMLKNWCF